jgi:HNH endonuclease
MSQIYIPAALRRLVRERSGDRCEYCLIPESVAFAPHWIDHIVAEKHGGMTDADNLANSCVLCNQSKGSDLTSIDPDTDQIVALFHPRRDRWTDHFRLMDGRIDPLTPVGRVTVRLLHLNDPDRVEERKHLIAAGLI